MRLPRTRYPTVNSPQKMANYDDGEVSWNYRCIVKRDDCPHLLTPENEKKRRAAEKEYGINSAFIRSMIYGEFVASEDSNVIFDAIHIELANRSMRGEFKPWPGEVRFAGDVSEGIDRAVFGVREGSDVLKLDAELSQSSLDVADKWVAWLKALGAQPSQFIIDGGGIGKTVGNYMESRLDYWGIRRFSSNNGPHEKKAFYDRYTELHWILRELLELEAIRLPFSKDLLNEMRDRRYVVMGDDMRVKCEPKREHKKRCNNRSPDHLDTLIYLLHDFPINEVRGKAQEVAAKARSADDDMSEWERSMQREATTAGGGAFADLPVQPDIGELADSRS